MRTFKRICVFCGASDHVAGRYFRAAAATGRLLARRGIGVVFGGGRGGLMGALADGALAEGGQVIGVIPRKLQLLERAHQGLTELRVVEGMHERKTLMAQLSDAFIALPGGWGTLEEILEATTWTVLGYHSKPVGLLNVESYYDGLLSFLESAAAKGFIRPQHRGLLCSASKPSPLLDRLAQVELPPPPVARLRAPSSTPDERDDAS